MMKEVEDGLKAAIAFQVALLEYQNADVADVESVKALRACCKAIDSIVKKIEREYR